MVGDKQTHALPARPEQIEQFAAFMGYADADALAEAVRARLERVEAHYAALFETSIDLGGGRALVFTGTDDDPDDARDPGRDGLRPAESGRGAGARLAPRPYPGDPRCPRARAADRADAAAAAGDRRAIRARTWRSSGSTSSSATCLPACSCSRCSAPIRACSALVVDLMGHSAAAGRPSQPPRQPVRGDAGPRLLRAAARRRGPRRRARPRVAPGARFSGRAGRGAALGAGARVSDRRCTCCSGLVDGDAASARLTDIAERLIQALLPRAEDWLSAQHGRVPGGAFVVLGLGKLGSRELSDRLRPRPDLRLRRARGRPLRRRPAAARSRPTTRASASVWSARCPRPPRRGACTRSTPGCDHPATSVR